MAESPRSVRRRTNLSTSQPWSDQDRTMLWQLRQELSHLTWTQLYEVVGPQFPGRSKSAITQECQKMERVDAERRMQSIKDRRNGHATAFKPAKRPMGDSSEYLKRRLPKEPRLYDHTADESSDDGGDIEFSGQRQPSLSRQSPAVPRPHENPLHGPMSVQSFRPQQHKMSEIQRKSKSHTSPDGVRTPAPDEASKSRPDIRSHTYPLQRRSAERMASATSQADIHTMSPSIPQSRSNHAVTIAGDPTLTPQATTLPNTPNSDVTQAANSNCPMPSHSSLQLPPKPPTPQSTTQEPTHQQSTPQQPTHEKPSHQQPTYQQPAPQPPPPTSQPPSPPGEPNKQYIEQLTGDQCLDGAVHLLARLTRIRIEESMAQGERPTENTALRQKIADLESRLEVQTQQLSLGNAKLLAMEKEVEETRKEIKEMRKERNVESQRLEEISQVLGVLGNAAKLFNTPAMPPSTGAAS
ncbi:uncharacterized protein DSM5745_00739 [Aspergillus mulundensis]|uniref:Uncharacterized protein n=1 Tax=Aspergillus mulundensis TaxID=1810919 RepID=A0A3D8T4D3_9EURO|nr:hypothetical protein DSM5745_00739 [Aspergillus mulundensis]RDW93417.1 hypothetical protein DSM5745_00739 [Aspergillus mulundensis]